MDNSTSLFSSNHPFCISIILDQPIQEYQASWVLAETTRLFMETASNGILTPIRQHYQTLPSGASSSAPLVKTRFDDIFNFALKTGKKTWLIQLLMLYLNLKKRHPETQPRKKANDSALAFKTCSISSITLAFSVSKLNRVFSPLLLLLGEGWKHRWHAQTEMLFGRTLCQWSCI